MGKEASEFARGWPILAASFVGIAIGVSSLFFYSLGIFIKPLAAEFGWSRGEASLGLALLAVGGAGLAVPGALIIGLSVGAEVDLMAFLTGRYFPKAVYGQTYGALYALFLIGGAIGPALSGYFFDVTGDYRLSLLSAAVLLAMAAFLATRLSIFRAANETAAAFPEKGIW